jgi:hypothetical protein
MDQAAEEARRRAATGEPSPETLALATRIPHPLPDVQQSLRRDVGRRESVS